MTRKEKPSQQKIPFVIDSIDPLGQGVCKQDGKITFIAKTLPGESGTARLCRSGKGVGFARLETLEQASSEREEAACPHYAVCPGCHYLHTSYDTELRLKQQSLERLLSQAGIDPAALQVRPATMRLGYRNRIQLHYRHKYIGLVDALSDTIVEIPQCQIIRPELIPHLQALYADKSWANTRKGGGHCELYLKDGAVSLAWNGPYAHGGFSQVNCDMNRVLCDSVTEYMRGLEATSVLDLFAGDGNLTNALVAAGTVERVMVDTTGTGSGSGFVRQDLFVDDALQEFRKRCPRKRFDLMVLDPPRKGFPALNDWVRAFRPQHLVYVSCNPATLVRDLESLEAKYRMDGILLIDLFPATYHFETVVLLTFK